MLANSDTVQITQLVGRINLNTGEWGLDTTVYLIRTSIHFRIKHAIYIKITSIYIYIFYTFLSIHFRIKRTIYICIKYLNIKTITYYGIHNNFYKKINTKTAP